MKFSSLNPLFKDNHKERALKVWEINELRKTVFHGKALKTAKFDGHLLSEESTAGKIFLAAQDVSLHFHRFEEMLDSPVANELGWTKDLYKLGGSLRNKVP